MKKNGFTLIELLSVIVILAVIALIATPIVLNVVENAQKKADLGSANGLIDAGRLYYSESLLDEAKKEKLENYENLWDQIVIQGEKPQNGFLYVNPSGKVALSVIYRHTCYQKEFETGLETLKESDCGLGFVGIDTKAPEVKFTVLDNPFQENNWAKEDFYVKVEIIDTDSGAKSYEWCTTQNEDCNPEIEQGSSEGTVLINGESATNKVCVMGLDQNENKSEIICSELYKLDKTKPNLSGIGDIVIGKDEIVDLETGVEGSDTLSGVKGTFTYIPTSVDTSKSGIIEVTYQIEDNAGNIQEYTRKIMVETGAPTVIFQVEDGKINENGWAKEDFLVTFTPNDQSGHGIKEFKWCSTTNSSCDPTGNTAQTTVTGAATISSESASNRICVIVTDNTGTSSTNICSDAYKLDKTAPVIGTSDVSVIINGSVNLTSGVSVIDALSGVMGSYSYNPTSVSTGSIGNRNVVYQATDQAGNIGTVVRTINVYGYTWQKYNTVTNYTYYWDKYNVITNTTDIVLTGTGSQGYDKYSDEQIGLCKSYSKNSYGTVSLSDCTKTDIRNVLQLKKIKNYPYLEADDGGTTFRKAIEVGWSDTFGILMKWEVYKIQSNTTYTQGSYIGEVTSAISSSYPQNGVSGAYWYVYTKNGISSYSKGSSYYGAVTSSSSSTYPSNGRHSDGYWYIRI